MYLNWEGAVGKEELRQLPGPFRVRRAHDLGWKPGLWGCGRIMIPRR
jgi:hypothetical protein